MAQVVVKQVQLLKVDVLHLKEEQVVVQDIMVVEEVQDLLTQIKQVVEVHLTMVIHKSQVVQPFPEVLLL